MAGRKNYVDTENRNSEGKKSNDRHWRIVVTIFVVFGLVVGLSLIIENFFAPEGWLFYEFDPRLRYSMTILLMLPVIQKVAE